MEMVRKMKPSKNGGKECIFTSITSSIATIHSSTIHSITIHRPTYLQIHKDLYHFVYTNPQLGSIHSWVRSTLFLFSTFFSTSPQSGFEVASFI